MSDNIEFFYNEETTCWEKREEPYATIEVPTEKDFKLLMEKIDFYDKKREEFDKICYDYSKLQEQFADYQKASDKEIKAQVEQAKIDALKEFAKRIIKRLFYVDTDEDGKEVKYGVLTSEEIWEIAEQFGVRTEDYDK